MVEIQNLSTSQTDSHRLRVKDAEVTLTMAGLKQVSTEIDLYMEDTPLPADLKNPLGKKRR